jgi:hypothetical protein
MKGGRRKENERRRSKEGRKVRRERRKKEGTNEQKGEIERTKLRGRGVERNEGMKGEGKREEGRVFLREPVSIRGGTRK